MSATGHPPFLLEGGLIIGLEDTTVGELAVHQPDQEHGFPFQAFRLVDGGERDLFVVGFRLVAARLAVGGAHQGELGEKFQDILEAAAVLDELLDIGAAGFEATKDPVFTAKEIYAASCFPSNHTKAREMPGPLEKMMTDKNQRE